jgi:hypothetical protein
VFHNFNVPSFGGNRAFYVNLSVLEETTVKSFDTLLGVGILNTVAHPNLTQLKPGDGPHVLAVPHCSGMAWFWRWVDYSSGQRIG